MSIEHKLLGLPGRDNALFARIHTRNSIHRLLFDSGDGCLSDLELAEVQLIDHLFFSHLHMDHVGGFDSFFRCTFNRDTKPNIIWGPPQTAEIIHHRFQGYIWNLTKLLVATWYINDVYPDHIETYRCEASESFAHLYHVGTIPFIDGFLLKEPLYTVKAIHMDHFIPSLAYVVQERMRYNVEIERMAAMGLHPGIWLKTLKDVYGENQPETIDVEGTIFNLAELRASLLRATPGESIAYLTDFLLDDSAAERLVPFLQGCTTIVCECQYRDSDSELAQRNHHMHPAVVAELAKKSQVGQLILFHVSERYRPPEWIEMLDSARVIFPSTSFPDHWKIMSEPQGEK
jgi:ribonuclease Z